MQNEELHNCRDVNALLKQTSMNIEKFGLQVIQVKATSYLPSFAYSTGLWQSYKHPEVICFGLSIELMHQLINDLADLIRQGEEFTIEKSYSSIFQSSQAAFLRVAPENIGDYFTLSMRYYGNVEFPAIQLVWTDRNNNFPWENDFEEEFLHRQPLLDRNNTFKFREAKNLGIFTTRQWLDLEQPILRVVHDHDGDWQFLTGDQLPEDIRLVCLEEMVQKDQTLNELFSLDYGESAERLFVGDKWIRYKEESAMDD
ncbi:DUF4262 domain-containing protein [Pseudoflavitalea sp. G-6-1-2]|uniref:DUF4262 domain-containing protein n=1 Tax=Pseudoflavitalea sp. G-6-1-2 TaxID=2728841 RepID=UPI00146F2860|nr:DUF4262 domain-containing protein [Pseudoflavitalea sp. G-6-1-2]NML23824.1 DUF4262 domain-containing protein [Pseudoflavitalea sp. G-6-1-2]